VFICVQYIYVFICVQMYVFNIYVCSYVFKCMCSIYICVFICVQMYVEYIHCNFIRHNSIIYVSDPIRIRSELDNFRTTLPLSLSIRPMRLSLSPSPRPIRLSLSLYVLCDSLPVLHDTIRLYDTIWLGFRVMVRVKVRVKGYS